jgi:hypothetical protein
VLVRELHRGNSPISLKAINLPFRITYLLIEVQTFEKAPLPLGPGCRSGLDRGT